MGKVKRQNVKIYNPAGYGSLVTQCEINGKKIENVVGVDFHVSVDEVPRFVFELGEMPDIEMNAEVKFCFTPKIVQEAATVIRKEIAAETITENDVRKKLEI